MAQRGGTRTGAGRPGGSRDAQTIATEAAVKASQKLTADVILEQIYRGATFDIRKLFDEDGNYVPVHKLSAADAMMIAGVEFVMGNLDKGDGKLDRVVKVRLIDRARYVEMGAKYHGLLLERVKVEDDKPLRQKVAAARQRLAAAKGKS
jgi:hypothetical protein